MQSDPKDQQRLRSLPLNATTVLLGREKPGQELYQAKEALERRTRELAYSLARMRATLESTTDSILVTDSEGSVTAFNKKYLEMWRIPLELANTTDHHKLLAICAQNFADPESYLARIDAIKSSAPPESFDLLELTDGRIFERFSRTQWLDGQNVGRVWSLRDITERKRMDEARFRLASLVESSQDAIISKTLEGVVSSWNIGAERIFGYTAAEIVGHPISLLIPLELRDEEPQILDRLRRGVRIDHYETVRLRKDGTLIDVSLTVSPIKDATGKIIGASKIARDISERKRTERELFETNQRLRALLNALPVGVAFSDDVTCQRVTGNPTACAQFGLPFFANLSASAPDENAEGRKIRFYQQGRLLHDAELPLQRAIAEDREIEPMELEVELPNGRRWFLSASGCPIRDDQGRVVSGVSVTVDISERRHVEEVLRREAQSVSERRQELELLVSERTASLQEAVAQMEEFSYSVSHDLRAPLRAMQGYATALLEDYGGTIAPEGREYLQRIVSAGLRMDRLTRDVLTYSKIPRTSLRLERMSMDKLVADIISQYIQDEARRAEIEVRNPLLDVMAHESLLAQALSNLVENAIKFSSPDRPQHICIWNEARDGQVRLWVEDSGIGVNPEYQSRIWGMFERLHPQTDYEGTGIGLAIVRKAVERMGGTVGVESDGVTGSKFWIQLPAA